MDEFRAVARLEVARTLAGYAGALALVTGIVVFTFPQNQPGPFVISLCAYGVLGLVLFAGTVLLSLGRHWLALALATCTLAVDSMLRLALGPTTATTLATMHLIVFLCLLGVMVVALAYRYTRAGSHR